MLLCQQCITVHSWLGKRCAFLKNLLPSGPFCPLSFYSQSLECRTVKVFARCIANSGSAAPLDFIWGLYAWEHWGAGICMAWAQGHGQGCRAGLGQSPKGTEVYGRTWEHLEDKTPKELLWRVADHGHSCWDLSHQCIPMEEIFSITFTIHIPREESLWAWVESEHTMVVSLSIFGMELDSGLCAVRMALDASCWGNNLPEGTFEISNCLLEDSSCVMLVGSLLPSLRISPCELLWGSMERWWFTFESYLTDLNFTEHGSMAPNPFSPASFYWGCCWCSYANVIQLQRAVAIPVTCSPV